MAEEKKRYRVRVPELHYEEKFGVASSPEDALKKALNGQFHTGETEYEDSITPDPSAPVQVEQLEGTGTVPSDEWEGLDTTGQMHEFLEDGSVVTQERKDAYEEARDAMENSMTKTEVSSKVKQALVGAKSEVIDATMRAGAAEFVDSVREPIVAALLREVGVENGMYTKAVGMFMRTSFGEGAFTYLMGIAVPLVVKMMPNEMAQEFGGKLGEELRVAGQAIAMRPLLRAVAGPVREFIAAKVRGDASPRLRVVAGEDGAKAEDHEEHVPARSKAKR